MDLRWNAALVGAVLALSQPLPVAALGRELAPAASLDSVLSLHVRGGRVDYGGLAKEPGPLHRFLAATESARLGRASRSERIAFWVNVYNARVLDAVLRRPGLRSVLDPGKAAAAESLDFFHEPRITAGRRLTLDDIEHRILRAEFGDPRIHFVLNCGSAGCPVLPERALRAAALDSTLDAATRGFLADRTKNRIAPDGALELSSIFDWFAKDFGSSSGSVPPFVLKYWSGPAQPPARARVRFLPYDWALNGNW